MEWTRRASPLERLIDLAVPLLVAAGAVFCAWAGGQPSWLVTAAGAVGGGAAALVMARVGGRVERLDFDLHEIAAPIEEPAADEALLLEDRLALPEDSRVVRLFAPDTTALPGELASRIDTWLEGARTRTATRVEAQGGGGHGPESSQASAALHAALAGIRQSLR